MRPEIWTTGVQLTRHLRYLAERPVERYHCSPSWDMFLAAEARAETRMDVPAFFLASDS